MEFSRNGRCDTDMAFIKSHGSYRKLRHIQRHNKKKIGMWVGGWAKVAHFRGRGGA